MRLGSRCSRGHEHGTAELVHVISERLGDQELPPGLPVDRRRPHPTGDPPVLALTATATEQVSREILEPLHAEMPPPSTPEPTKIYFYPPTQR
jgi:hypothetical protein